MVLFYFFNFHFRIFQNRFLDEYKNNKRLHKRKYEMMGGCKASALNDGVDNILRTIMTLMKALAALTAY